MKNRHTCRLAIGLVLALAVLGPMALVSHGNAAGPPPGRTGAPGELTCTACHSTFAVNSGTATFLITSAPTFVEPGTSYSVTVAFGSSTGTTHGFQITARDGSGSTSGTWGVSMAGMTQSVSSNTYHEQTAAGTALTSWTMTWTSPATLPSGPVHFYAAGNEANGDGTDNFDHIYTSQRKSSRLILVGYPWISYSLPFTLNGGGSYAGNLYFIIPSDDPTPFSLGFIGSPLELEVTPNFSYLDLVQQYPQVFQSFFGVLDAAGQGTATLVVPPGLSGFQFHVAAVTLSAATISVTEVSNRETIVIP